jgi:hypothetical protein
MSLTKVTNSMISGAFINVLDYGANPNGVDSYAALQAAITAANGVSPVYFPPGDYVSSQPLVLKQGQSIVGSNQTPTDWRRPAASVCTITFTSATAATTGFTLDQADVFSGYVWNVAIKNIDIVGSNTANSVGINFINIAFAEIENVGVSKFGIGLYINFGMLCTYKNVNLSGCLTSSLYIAGTSNVTTTQKFYDCTFRESPWGVIIESNGSGNSFGSIFENCLIESTSVGGVNIHRTCGASFYNTYMENVPGVLFKVNIDGTPSSSNYADIIIQGGDIAGLNSGLSTTGIDVGYCRQLTIVGPLIQRCTNGIKCDTTNTPDNSVYVFAPEFISVTNRFVNDKNKVNGTFASAVASSARTALTYSSFYYARRSNGGTDMFVATADSVDHGVKMGILGSSQAGSLTATHSSGGSTNLVFQVTASGVEVEAGRFTTSGNLSLPISGTGVRLVSPNGLVTKTITIDNSGAIVLL